MGTRRPGMRLYAMMVFCLDVSRRTRILMILTLTTDFGHKDPFVGIMKGVILGINPAAQIVDLSHAVPSQDIRTAAVMLSSAFAYFPRGTIHVVVVDPDVGTNRRPILIKYQDQYFVGPDNGVLSLSLEGREPTRIIHLSNEVYHLQPKSRTFHGRDIFAPVAAHLSLGVFHDLLGEPIEDYVRLYWPQISRLGRSILGEVLYIDGFGNVFTNIRERDLTGIAFDKIRVSIGDLEFQGVSDNYTAGETGNYLAVINSWGLIEVALYKDSAAKRSKIKVGDKVQIECSP